MCVLPVGVSQRVQGVFARGHSRRDGRYLCTETLDQHISGLIQTCWVTHVAVLFSYHACSGVFSDEGVPQHLG